MKIEILGSGCPNCKKVVEITRKAIEETKVNAEIIKITNIGEIINYGVMSTPAIVINGEIKSYGRIPDIEEIKNWLKK
ncbi:TM0996/MTH895 family glutaredoxin-like protein [Candidatus Micrarchaeota archaeon]|nr:TM0996/MTH895 family glutaredoxin-like protein [Candidatus Micrarchaeota archaeon]